MTFLRQSAAVAGKDLRIEVRGRYALGAVLPFAATLLVAFGLSLGPDRVLLQRTAPGLLWLAWSFVAPGENLGLAFDGLVRLDERFAWFPRPWQLAG